MPTRCLEQARKRRVEHHRIKAAIWDRNQSSWEKLQQFAPVLIQHHELTMYILRISFPFDLSEAREHEQQVVLSSGKLLLAAGISQLSWIEAKVEATGAQKALQRFPFHPFCFFPNSWLQTVLKPVTSSFPACFSYPRVRKSLTGILWRLGYELASRIGRGGFSASENPAMVTSKVCLSSILYGSMGRMIWKQMALFIHGQPHREA